SVPPEVLAGASPRSREVAGADGRHYHIRRVRLDSRDAWLVAEVSSLLVVRRMRSTLLSILVPATLSVLLFGSAVAGLVARRSVRQLTELADEVERSAVSSPRELGTTATDREVRVMATALTAAFERVHAMLAREKAFVGDVSHELRTPMAVIRGAAELLDRRDLDPTARAQVGRILEAAQSGEEIVGLLLALAREETAHEAAKPISLLALVEALVVRHRQLLGRADVEVHVDIAPQMRVMAPPAAAEVVISNLIANALRHGGGTVEISGREASLAIRDHGGGLDPAVTGGRGIGLNLVRRLCDVSGFTLTFDSSTAGTAAVVVFAKSGSAGAAISDQGTSARVAHVSSRGA
ncbi:MAG TPA: HAMP domain-containing sensor histidine kinase, partial [Thermoanaerobaculia bacterium]|nr:HAMP domain-containing sensor histidine kinase [Thermoanaerobaculia bacterium]